MGLFDAGGVLQNQVGTSGTGSGYDVPTSIPISGAGSISAGQTWYFQLWHREQRRRVELLERPGGDLLIA
ncbi:MAG: hypothetical protein R3E96_04340 [Planctomycetota bacterium]